MIWSCDDYRARVTGLATRGVGELVHDAAHEEKNLKDVVLVWITVESHDSINDVDQAVPIIMKDFTDLGRERLHIIPFAHLSNELAEMKTANTVLDAIYERILEQMKNNVTKEHFGSDKEVELLLKGHPGNIRYREIKH